MKSGIDMQIKIIIVPPGHKKVYKMVSRFEWINNLFIYYNFILMQQQYKSIKHTQLLNESNTCKASIKYETYNSQHKS